MGNETNKNDLDQRIQSGNEQYLEELRGFSEYRRSSNHHLEIKATILLMPDIEFEQGNG